MGWALLAGIVNFRVGTLQKRLARQAKNIAISLPWHLQQHQVRTARRRLMAKMLRKTSASSGALARRQRTSSAIADWLNGWTRPRQQQLDHVGRRV